MRTSSKAWKPLNKENIREHFTENYFHNVSPQRVKYISEIFSILYKFPNFTGLNAYSLLITGSNQYLYIICSTTGTVSKI
jgi:hypothetical protein